MKKEIHCEPCSHDMKKIIGQPVQGEHVAFTSGRALSEYRCDFCGAGIEPLAKCVAFSLWTDTIPLIVGWEKQYLVVEESDVVP